MSGKDFIAFLKRNEFPNINELNPNSIDWMFNLNGTKDLMQWLCYDITSKNMISPEEISRFEKLRELGGVILDNEKLDEVLSEEGSNSNMFTNALYAETPAKRIEILKKQIEETELKIKSVKNRHNLLTKQRIVLESQNSAICKKLPKVEMVSKIVDSESRTETSNIKKNDEIYTETVTSFLPVLDNFNIYYDEFCHRNNNGTQTTENLFLSQTPIDRYFNLEAEHSKELQNFTCKLFSSNRTTSSKDDFVSSFVDIVFANDQFQDVETNSISFKNETDERLQLMKLSMSDLEIKSIKAAARLAASKEVRDFIDSVMSDLRKDTSDIFPTDPSITKELQLRQEEESMLMTNGNHDLFDKHISKQVEINVAKEISEILLKNYNNEFIWKKKFLENQKRVITMLVNQKSRIEFLVLALNLELDEHKNIDLVMSTIFESLNVNKLQSLARINSLKEIVNRKMTQSSSMPISLHKERFLHSLRTILISPSSSPICGDASLRKLQLTMDDLKNMSLVLSKKIANLKLEEEMTHVKSQEGARLLRIQMKEIINTFPPSALKPPPKDGQIRFTQMLQPTRITQSVSQFEEIIKRLDKSIGEMFEEVKKKKSTIANDKLLQRERLLFVYFFTNPEMFLSEMKQIKADVLNIRR